MLNSALPVIVGIGPAVLLVVIFMLIDFRRSRRS